MAQESSNVKALKAGGWYVVSTFLIKGIAYLTTPIFTRLLTTNEYGIASNYQSWLTVFTVIATLDLYSCIQLSKVRFNEDNKQFLSSILTLSSLAVAATYLVCKCIQAFVPSLFSLPSGLLEIMFVEILTKNVFTLLQTNHRAYLKYKAYVAMSAVSTLSSTALAVLLVWLMDTDKYYGKIIGNALPMIVIGLAVAVYILARGKTLFSRKYWQFGLKVSVPLIPHHLAGDVLAHSDRIVINTFLGSTQTALYTVASNYGMIMQVIWTAFNGAWTPWFYEKLDANNENSLHDIRRFVKPYLMVFVILALLFEMTAPEAILIFGTKEYKGSEYVVPFVVAGIVCQFVYSLYANIEFFYQKTARIAYGTLISAGLNLVLNIIFVPRYGYVAAGVTTFVSYFVLMFLHYFMARRIDCRDLFDIRFIIKLLLVFGILSGGIVCIYPWRWIRYAVAAVITMIVLLKYRNHAETIMKKIFKMR
ncbi:MAG: lipopolysaccharide biosynthesis protein [Bacteroides fragilis]|nr:lipopolysaccharide biosynthesis protein [Bacteroides fragilis]